MLYNNMHTLRLYCFIFHIFFHDCVLTSKHKFFFIIVDTSYFSFLHVYLYQKLILHVLINEFAVPKAEDDFTEMTATLTFGPSSGEQSCFFITIRDDIIFEETETFSVVLESLEALSGGEVPSVISITQHSTEVLIIDDESES